MQNTIIKDYHIHSELGRGGMATVYLAHDNKFDTNVAIKVLNKEFVNNENIRKRFLAEAKNMFKMSHPNIIKVTDLIDEGETVAFVMEYIEGQTLKEYIDQGKLSDDEIKTIFSQMLEAVGYVHDKKLVHRDIKPSNFMINSEGQIKLMDFGIAKTTDITSAEYTQTGTGVQMGTPMYMSPEQVKNSKEVTYTTDIYSLGVVLWQMVTRQKPYDTNELSVPEIQVNIIKQSLPITTSIYDDIIQKATQKNPEQRYKNTQSFQVDIKYPTNSNNLESTIEETKELTGEKTLVEQPKKNINPSSSQDITPNLNNETKKNRSKKGFHIAIGFVIVAFIVFYYKELLFEEDVVSVAEEVDINVGEPISEIGNSIIYTVRQYYDEERKNDKYAVPIVVYFNGKYIQPPHCIYGDNSQSAFEECEKSKEILLPSVQPGSILFEIHNGKQTNSINVIDNESFGYSDWTLFSGKISKQVNPLLLTDNHKIGTNKLAQIKEIPIVPEANSLLGMVDIDGDGMPEYIYEVSEYEGTSYEIFSNINGEWKVVYNGGYQGV